MKARPIQVTGSKGIHGTVFSEFALACIFALAKKLPNASTRKARSSGRSFNRWRSKAKPSASSASAPSAWSWRAKPRRSACASWRPNGILAISRTYVDELGGPDFLPRLLAQSDFVVLLLASVPSTFNIIGEKELRAMKPSAYFINLTGGRAVEETLLVRAP